MTWGTGCPWQPDMGRRRQWRPASDCRCLDARRCTARVARRSCASARPSPAWRGRRGGLVQAAFRGASPPLV